MSCYFCVQLCMYSRSPVNIHPPSWDLLDPVFFDIHVLRGLSMCFNLCNVFNNFEGQKLHVVNRAAKCQI